MDLNETMHSMPISTINHENNVSVLLLVHRGAVKPTESKGVIKYTVIWKVCTEFLVKSSGNFPEIKISGNFRKDRNKLPEIFRRKFPDSQPSLPLPDLRLRSRQHSTANLW